MSEYSRPLGNAIKQARKKMDLTQGQVADAVNIDTRTILNIENYKGNPKMEILYPLVRALRIDPDEIFYPEMQRESPALHRLRTLLETCTDEEVEYLLPIFEHILHFKRTQQTSQFE